MKVIIIRQKRVQVQGSQPRRKDFTHNNKGGIKFN